jgi:hypothetical protein
VAQRPVFLVRPEDEHSVHVVNVEFEWVPGMAISQKQKCVRSLHDAIGRRGLTSRVLEVSSKSEDPLGVELSAFRLSLPLRNREQTTVESAFQGSKVFHEGGPYTDLLNAAPHEAKRDKRLKESGPLRGFSFEGERWSLTPRTAFYDWLYLRALAHRGLHASDLKDFDAFTDIEFNPRKSVNCQARSVALFCALSGDSEIQLDELLESRAEFVVVNEARFRQDDLEPGSLFGSHSH